jgi:hypothetical protein
MAFDLPEVGPARDAAILAALGRGELDITWGSVRVEAGGHVIMVNVTADAVKLNGVRVDVSAQLNQQIADGSGALLLTAKMADLCWLQRSVAIDPPVRPITDSTAAMVDTSQRIDAALADGGYAGGLISGPWKFWLIDNQIPADRAMNYGFFVIPDSGMGWRGIATEAMVTVPSSQGRAIQGRGTVHNMMHTDYSQLCHMMHRACLADGVTRDLLDVLQDPDLAPLISHEGPLQVLRQPGVDVYQLSIASRLPSGAGLAVGAFAGALVAGPPGAVAGGVGGLAFDWWRGRKV